MRRLLALVLVGGLVSTTAWSSGGLRPGASGWAGDATERALAWLGSWCVADAPRSSDGVLLVPEAYRRGTGHRVSIAELDGRLPPDRLARSAALRKANSALFPPGRAPVQLAAVDGFPPLTTPACDP